jgi:hypothetical protein
MVFPGIQTRRPAIPNGIVFTGLGGNGSPTRLSSRPFFLTSAPTVESSGVLALSFIQPMLLKTAAVLPRREQWRYELKFDGFRGLAVKDGKEVRVVFAERPRSVEAVPHDH